MYIGGFLWPRRRQKPRSIVEILNDLECFVSVGMLTRGESIALNSEGTSYFAHSEGTNQPITAKWKKNSANIFRLYLATSLRLVTLMKKKVVENQKISTHISMNICNRGDERS